MTDGQFILMFFAACFLWGKLCGIRNQLKRIADVAESAEKRASEHNR